MDDNKSISNGGDRRYAPNLQGLLRFCTENTKSEDAVGSSFQPMSEEKKQWLKNALETITSNDPIKKMMEHLKVIMKTSDQENCQENLEEKENALEELILFCEDIDLANDFYKIGGFEIFTILLNCPHPSLKWRAADLIASLVQNNPYCQDKVVEDENLFQLLLNKLLNVNESTDVRIKCLYAISCLTREHPKAQKVLIKNEGFVILLSLLHSDVRKLQIKSLFLINSLCLESDIIKDLVQKLGIIGNLIGLVKSEPHSEIHEHATKVLLTLATNYEPAKLECKKESYNLKIIIENAIKDLKDREDNEEEVEDLKELQRVCFS